MKTKRYFAVICGTALSLFVLGCASVPPMYWAIYHQENDKVEAMLDGGQDPNVRWLSSSPLHQAVGSDNLGAVILLLQRGADPLIRDRSRRTPLMLARQRNRDPRIIKALEDAEAGKLGLGAASSLPATQTTLAVMDLAVSSGLSPEQAGLLTDKLVSELAEDGAFAVTERARRDQALASRGFKQSTPCDQTTCLVSAGQALGVRKVVGGSLGKFGKGYAVDLKLVDVWTGTSEKTFTKVYEGDVLVLLGAMQEAAAAFSGPKPSVPAIPEDRPLMRKRTK